MAGQLRGTDSPQGPGVRIPKEGGRSRSPLDQGGLPWWLSGSPSAFTIPLGGAQGPRGQHRTGEANCDGETRVAALSSGSRDGGRALEEAGRRRSEGSIRLWGCEAVGPRSRVSPTRRAEGRQGWVSGTWSQQVPLLAADEVCLVWARPEGSRGSGFVQQGALRPESTWPQALVGPGALLWDGLRGRQALP